MTHPLPLGDGDVVNDVSVASRSYVSVEVSDPDAPDLSEISRVRFYINGAIVASNDPLDAAPDITRYGNSFAAALDFNAPGSHVMFATVTDSDGNTAFALPLALDVGQLQSPMPSIVLKPLPGEVPVNEPVQLEAEVDGKLNSVERVDFFANGVIIGSSETLTENTASITWVPNVEMEGVRISARAVQIDPGGQFFDNWQLSDSIELDITAPDGEQPEIRITSPLTDEQLTVGNRHIIQADATPGTGTVRRVDFYQNGQLIGSDETWPYEIEFVPQSTGRVRLFARVTNSSNDYNVSDVHTVIVGGNGPTEVVVYWPSDGASLPLNREVPLIARVHTTGSGQSVQVSFYVNGDLVGTATESPYRVYWKPTSPGDFDIAAVVEELGGLDAKASSVEISVSVDISESPQFSFLGAVNGEAIAGSDVQLQADVVDRDGSVDEVIFFVNGVLVGSDDTAPFNTVWRPRSAGDFELRAEATDSAGNVTVFTRSITVTADEAPDLTEFSIDLESGSGTQSDPYVARVNQPFAINVRAADDHGVASVVLTRGSEQLPNPGGIEVPVQFSDLLTAVGIYRYRAEITDTAGNVRSSGTIFVTATRGAEPQVAIQSPVDGSQVAAGSPVTVRVSATSAVERVGPVGSITEVEFFANGTLFSVLQSPPYTVQFIPPSEGIWTLRAIATSDTGLKSEPEEVVLEAIDGSIPEIITFTNDTTGNRSLVSVPISFRIAASDDAGIEQVELLLDGSTVVATAAGGFGEFVYTPASPGVYRFSARALNAEGHFALSTPMHIRVESPAPLESVDDFVFQTYLDLLGRTPTPAEASAASAGLNPRLPLDQQTGDEMLVVRLVESAEFEAVRAALFARFLLEGEWPPQETAQNDLKVMLARSGAPFGDGMSTTAKAAAVQALVQTMMPAFEVRYRQIIGAGDELRVPVAASSEGEIDRFLGVLWELKYGEPNPDPSALRLPFRAFGRDGFVARFILDVGNITSPSGQVRTPVLALADPPNDDARFGSISAAIQGGLWQVQPSAEEVDGRARDQLFQQVADVLADPRYTARFITPFPNLEQREDGWNRSTWLGWFFPHPSGWNWSSEQRWIYFYLNGQSSESFWYYHATAGWLWTNASLFPALYSDEEESWLYFGRFTYREDELHYFYSYKLEEWIRR